MFSQGIFQFNTNFPSLEVQSMDDLGLRVYFKSDGGSRGARGLNGRQMENLTRKWAGRKVSRRQGGL